MNKLNLKFQSGMQHEKLLQQCLENLIVLPNIHITSKNTPGAKQVDSEDKGVITIHSPLKSVDYMYAIQPDVTSITAEFIINDLLLQQKK
ncbi:MAG: hypothetical protein AAFW70_20705 [Cyanobacteria bacterium J06635_10]